MLDIASFDADGHPNIVYGTFTPDPNATTVQYTIKSKLTWLSFLRLLIKRPKEALRWLRQPKGQKVYVPGQEISGFGFQPDAVLFWPNDPVATVAEIPLNYHPERGDRMEIDGGGFTIIHPPVE